MRAKIKNTGFYFSIFFSLIFLFTNCDEERVAENNEGDYKILFLHHSTGMTVWKGSTGKYEKIKKFLGVEYDVPEWFDDYNRENGSHYSIEERSFPKGEPYPWNNYPYDYYTIWVENAGSQPFNEEPTLEMLTGDYDMIIFKHCFPVSQIQEDGGSPDIGSPEKRLENYKLQYNALKEKMLEFPETRFLVWTGAANVKQKTTPEEATRAREFVDWVIAEWDTPDDNIFLWDFFGLETEGGIYLLDEYARNPQNSHPNYSFTGKIAPLFGQRIVDVIETNGKNTTLTGQVRE